MTTTPYRLVRSRQSEQDLRAVLRFLVQSHIRFGVPFAEAKRRASARLLKIRDHMNALSAAPHKGALRPELAPGLRNVTKDRAVFYFTVDDDAQVVRVLAVFFGGQDHQRAMLKRLRKLK
jgi:toxin ParE1/3/4